MLKFISKFETCNLSIHFNLRSHFRRFRFFAKLKPIVITLTSLQGLCFLNYSQDSQNFNSRETSKSCRSKFNVIFL